MRVTTVYSARTCVKFRFGKTEPRARITNPSVVSNLRCAQSQANDIDIGSCVKRAKPAFTVPYVTHISGFRIDPRKKIR